MLSVMCVAGELARMNPNSIIARARERQAVALQAADAYAQRRQAERHEKPSRTRIAADIGLGYDQYVRYVDGTTPLKVEQIELFARVYEIPPGILARSLLTGDVSQIEALDQPPYDMATDLRGEIPESDIPEFEDEHGGKSPLDAAAAARGVKRNANRARSKSGIQPKPSGPNRNRTA